MSPEDWERYHTGYYNEPKIIIDEEEYNDD